MSAVHAKVPVLLHDRSSAQVKSGLALFDKIISKDVSKGKLTSEAAKEARDRITVVGDLKGFRDADMVVEVSTLHISFLLGTSGRVAAGPRCTKGRVSGWTG